MPDDTHPMVDAPNRIREWRERIRMTREQLADAVGLTPMSIYRLETGKTGLREDRLYAIAKVLGCEPHQLLATTRLMDERNSTPSEDFVAMNDVYSVVLAVETWQKKRRVNLDPEQKASVVKTILENIEQIRNRDQGDIDFGLDLILAARKKT